jgi:hypothetical protein
MQTTSRNKMLASRHSARTAFIIEKSKTFSADEIALLLPKEGFAPISRSRIYEILKGRR